MVLLLGLVIGSLSFYLDALNRTASPTQQADNTRAALAEAKRILIAWAAESEVDHNGPGHLPCPDNTNDGHGQGSGCGPLSRLGRFPWATLNAPDLRDAGGERLWYAVSPNFLNKATNPVNSDTRGMFRISGATQIDDVIAIVFAPGPALPGQERGSAAAQLDPINYLEDPNPGDDDFPAEAEDGTSNDRMVFITAADLYPAVERTVASRLQRRIVPILHEYLSAWQKANADAGQSSAAALQLPYAAPFDPGADAACGQPGLWRGALPLGYCPGGLTATWSGGVKKSATTCTEVVGLDGTLATISCAVVLKGGDDDCDGDGTDNQNMEGTLDLEAGYRTLAMPIDPAKVVTVLPGKNKKGVTTVKLRSPPSAQSIKLADGRIRIEYEGKFKVSECRQDDEYLTVKLDFPLQRADTVYYAARAAAIDADGSLTQVVKDAQKDVIDPTWFFNNGWPHLTYYAASAARLPSGSGAPATLAIESGRAARRSTADADALLMLAGRATRYTGSNGLPKNQERPSVALVDYFERTNGDDAQQSFEQYNPPLGVNDRIVSICPWSPNPYRQETPQACP